MRKSTGFWAAAALATLAVVPAAVASEGQRDQLAQASFADRDKATALRRVQSVLAAVDSDTNFEAVLMRATALGYRAKLTGSRGDLTASKKLFDALVEKQPRNPDAQLGLGAWHMGVVARAGPLLGRVLGASRAAGHVALDRAVAAGGNRALYAGLGGLLRVKADPTDARGRELVERAAHAGAPSGLDRVVQRAATTVAGELRTGDTAGARAAAQRLLPFGMVAGLPD